MSDRILKLKAKAPATGEWRVTLHTSERVGRWVARLSPPASGGAPPDLAESGNTQRVWVGDSETAAAKIAMDWLRIRYTVTDESTRRPRAT